MRRNGTRTVDAELEDRYGGGVAIVFCFKDIVIYQ
jgi:hypothetical protein